MSVPVDDDDYYVPLVDQRVFGAGIKRKRIAFVPATDEQPSIPKPSSSTAGNAGARYLSIVLKKNSSLQAKADEETQTDSNGENTTPILPLCPVCGQAVSETDGENKPHESSIAHQICLDHSHPPSHLDRSHVGLKYLQEYGWNPDARIGLGARSEGIRIPIKAKEKNDSAGLGMTRDDEESSDRVKVQKKAKAEDNTVRLNAKQVRKMENDKSKHAERLRRNMYGPDLSQYLGPEG